MKVKCKCKISEHDDRVCTQHGVYGFIDNPTDECFFCELQEQTPLTQYFNSLYQ